MLLRQFKALSALTLLSISVLAALAIGFTFWQSRSSSQMQVAQQLRSEQSDYQNSKEGQALEAEYASKLQQAHADLVQAAALIQGLQQRLESQREGLRRDWSVAIHRQPTLIPDPTKDPALPASPDPVLLQLSQRQEALDALSARVLQTATAFQVFQSTFAASASAYSIGSSKAELHQLERQIQSRHTDLLQLLAANGLSGAPEVPALRASLQRLSPTIQGEKSLVQIRLRQQLAMARQRQKLEGFLGRLDSFLMQQREKQLSPWVQTLSLGLGLLALCLCAGAIGFGRQILAGLRSLLDEQSQLQETLTDWEFRHAEVVAGLDRRTEQCRQWVGRVAERGEQITGIAQLLATATTAIRHRLTEIRSAQHSQEEARSALAEAAARLAASQSAIRQGASGLSQIASQSRILSFNASVEASRSGEGGAAFLVVADAMRLLAERSSQTAAQIETSCEHSQLELTQVQNALQALDAPSALLVRASVHIADSVEQQSEKLKELSQAATRLQPAKSKRNKSSRRSPMLTLVPAPETPAEPESGEQTMVA